MCDAEKEALAEMNRRAAGIAMRAYQVRDRRVRARMLMRAGRLFDVVCLRLTGHGVNFPLSNYYH